MRKIHKNYLMIICLLCISLLSTKANAQHFNFEGGSISDPLWTIYISGATFDGIEMEANEDIRKIEYLLNSRTRKRLDWKTPWYSII